MREASSGIKDAVNGLVRGVVMHEHEILGLPERAPEAKAEYVRIANGWLDFHHKNPKGSQASFARGFGVSPVQVTRALYATGVKRRELL